MYVPINKFIQSHLWGSAVESTRIDHNDIGPRKNQ